jgi:ferritin-like metal-binding protein YciE
MGPVSSLEEIYAAQLRELFSAETQSVPALVALLDAASDPVLAESFREHCIETLDHAEQIEQLLANLGQEARGQDCEAIGALVREVEKAAQDQQPSRARDLALIEAAQEIEHYEMACYGSVHTYASVLGEEKAAAILQKILDQEADTDLRLAEVTKRLNAAAQAETPAAAAFHERNP